jgi:HlyD family secretion protein
MKMKRFGRKKMILSCIVMVVIVGGSYYLFIKGNKAKTAAGATETIVAVTKGEIRNTISGTSQIEAKDMRTISAPADGTIKTMNLSKNLTVKKGDLLFEVSNPDIEVALQKAQLSLTQLQNDYEDLSRQQQALAAKAPISGKLTYAANIDTASQVSKSTKIATISDSSTLIATLPFLLEDAVQLNVGDSVDLTIDGYMLTKTGTVQKISKTPKADISGNKILNVDVEVENDRTLDAGIKVMGGVSIQGTTLHSQEQAILQYVKIFTVLANTSGIIDTLKFKSEDIVNQGDIISLVSNETINNDLAVKKTAIEQQKVTVNNLQDKMDSLNPVGAEVVSAAPFGGLSSLDSMQLSIQVDELDLPSIKDKMQANVKVDSISGQSFQGEVNQISTVGTTTSGVTAYTVVLSVPNTNQLLKYGMTATAEILIEDKKDIVTIPVEAVQSRQGKKYVTLKKADGTNEAKEVTVGISNKTMVEITEGLKEGDKLVTLVLQKQTQSLSQADIDAMRKQFQNSSGSGGSEGPPDGGGGPPPGF